MTGAVIGFFMWAVVGLGICGLGIAAHFQKKPMGFWANAEMFEVTNVKRYNAAVGKIFFLYGAIFILLGLPLLDGQNSAWILLSVLGVMFETIAMMAVYILVVEKKYKKR